MLNTDRSEAPPLTERAWPIIEELFDAASAFGLVEYEDGTVEVGHTPLRGPEAYLHAHFPGLSDVAVAEVRELCPVPLPQSYARFLRRSNGVFLFHGSIGMYGFNESRLLDRSGLQPRPWDVVNANRFRNVQAPSDAFAIGASELDASKFFIVDDGSVVRFETETWRPISKSADLESFLVDAIARVSVLFDPTGVPIVPETW